MRSSCSFGDPAGIACVLKFTLGEAHTSSGVGQKGFGGKAPWRLLHLTFPRAFVKHGPWAPEGGKDPWQQVWD